MNPAAQAALAKWREENPDQERTQRNPYQRWQDQDTRKTAIGAFCYQCVGGDAGYRTSIKESTCNGKNGATLCPLYTWRPYK